MNLITVRVVTSFLLSLCSGIIKLFTFFNIDGDSYSNCLSRKMWTLSSHIDNAMAAMAWATVVIVYVTLSTRHQKSCTYMSTKFIEKYFLNVFYLLGAKWLSLRCFEIDVIQAQIIQLNQLWVPQWHGAVSLNTNTAANVDVTQVTSLDYYKFTMHVLAWRLWLNCLQMPRA